MVEHLGVGRSFLQMDSQRVVKQSLLDDGQLAVVTLDDVVSAGGSHVYVVSLQDLGQRYCPEVLTYDIRVVSCELQHHPVVPLVVLVARGLKG